MLNCPNTLVLIMFVCSQFEITKINFLTTARDLIGIPDSVWQNSHAHCVQLLVSTTWHRLPVLGDKDVQIRKKNTIP